VRKRSPGVDQDPFAPEEPAKSVSEVFLSGGSVEIDFHPVGRVEIPGHLDKRFHGPAFEGIRCPELQPHDPVSGGDSPSAQLFGSPLGITRGDRKFITVVTRSLSSYFFDQGQPFLNAVLGQGLQGKDLAVFILIILAIVTDPVTNHLQDLPYILVGMEDQDAIVMETSGP
jgi:hypothetical protein